MKTTVYTTDRQGTGAFDGGKITEIKPIDFPGGTSEAARIGPLFYWAWASSSGEGVIGNFNCALGQCCKGGRFAHIGLANQPNTHGHSSSSQVSQMTSISVSVPAPAARSWRIVVEPGVSAIRFADGDAGSPVPIGVPLNEPRIMLSIIRMAAMVTA